MKFNFDNNLLVEEDLVLKEDSLDQCRSDANSICKMLDKNNIWYELVDYDMYPMNTSKISFEVSGDWKHDHWAFKDILNDWAEENDRDIFKIDEEEIGESQSDDYVARYDVFITADKDSYNKLNSMRGLFAEGLNPKEKQIYVDAVNEAEDIEDLEDICHEIYFYDKRLFAQINKKPKDGDVEKMRANMLKYLQESIKESKMFGYNYRYDVVWYNKEGKRIKFGFTNDINDAENIVIRACKHIYGMSPSNDRAQFLDSLDIEDTDNKNTSVITSRVVSVKDKFLSKLENKDESLNESSESNYVVEPHKIDMDLYDIVFVKDHSHAGERAHSKRFTSYDDALKFIKRNAKYNNWNASPINEDTIKTKDGKWTNKGSEGTHGKFKTKKEADAQRKAMFANGFHESLKESTSNADFLVPILCYLDDRFDKSKEIDQVEVSVNDLYLSRDRNYIDKLLDNAIRDEDRFDGQYYGDESLEGLIRRIAYRKWYSEKPRHLEDYGVSEDGGFDTGRVIILNKDLIPSRVNKLSRFLGKKLMSSNESLKESIYDWPIIIDNTNIQLPIFENELIYFIETSLLNSKYNIDFIDEVKLVTSGVDEANRKYYNLKVSGFLKRENKIFRVPVRVWEDGTIEDSRNPLPPVENVIDESLSEDKNYEYDLARELASSLNEFLFDREHRDAMRSKFGYKYVTASSKSISSPRVEIRAYFNGDDSYEDFINAINYWARRNGQTILSIDQIGDEKEISSSYDNKWVERIYNIKFKSPYNESLKEEVPYVRSENKPLEFDNDFINYNDFLANNFDGWSDDIDDLRKELSKCARALKTVSNKLVFYVDYDEDFYIIDDIAKVVKYIDEDYSLYQLNDLSGIYFVFGSDNLWIFKNEKEANHVISLVKVAVKEMNESLQAKLDEGLLDSIDDFKTARNNWKKVVKDISFDVALERWNKESDLADPDWFAKPIYSVKAWNDMVNMFSKQDDLEEAPIEEDLDYDPDKLPDLDDIDKMEWKVDEEDGSEFITIDEINKSVYVALGDNGYYTFLYDGDSNSITPLDDYIESEEDAKASAKEFLKDYVEGFY